ncbi:MAG TPA: hypothetical protein VF801_15830, partial [Rhodocyclaceae bacterium]
MNMPPPAPDPLPRGIRFVGDGERASRALLMRLEELGLHRYVSQIQSGDVRSVCLRRDLARSRMPHGDTTRLASELDLGSRHEARDLECEILLAMLAAPQPFEYPGYEELAAAVNVRLGIVDAAARTQLAFDTAEAERPADYWTYDEERGFTVLPGKSLIAALERATQPDASGRLYSFSCYRATEYVILLAIARELATVNPPLLARLQLQWETQAIKSGRFHEAFLYDLGSMEEPLPSHYYVPGDRVWFRNPDERSSDIAGYEGSWVFYLGGGLFSNFWKRDAPYTLTTKAVEIFHWRHGARDGSTMDESIVERMT